MQTKNKDENGMSPIVECINEYASENGLIVVESRPDVIQIDIDNSSQEQQYRKLLPLLRQFVKITREVETKSESGNKHVYLVLADPLEAAERIAIQACLGSDPKRELLSLRNVRAQRTLPMFLYEKKENDLLVADLTPSFIRQEAAQREAEFVAVFGDAA